MAMRRVATARSTSSVIIWGVALTAITALATWKFGWIPIELSEPATGHLAESAPADSTDSVPEMPSVAESEGTDDVPEPDFMQTAADPDLIAGNSASAPGSKFLSRGQTPRVIPTRSILAERAALADPWDSHRTATAAEPTAQGFAGNQEPPATDVPDGFGPAASPAGNMIAQSRGFQPGTGIPSSLAGSDQRSASVPARLNISGARPLPPTSPDNRSADIRLAGETVVTPAGTGAGESRAGSSAIPSSSTRFPTGNSSFSQPASSTPSATEPAELAEIDGLIAEHKLLAAHRLLSSIYWKQPQARPAIQSRIDEVARAIYFEPTEHFMPPHEIEPGDVLSRIARRYQVPWEYLVRLNRIDARRIRPGQKIKVIKGPFNALVDLSDFELTVYAHGYYVKKYTVGIGRDGGTPVGRFKVLDKVVNPQYTDPDGKVISGDDPANPLGERWMSIGNSYGIHGTIDPESIGKAESRGCVRMLSEDVAELYDLLTVGSEVIIQR